MSIPHNTLQDQARANLNSQIEAFLKSGGTIKQLKSNCDSDELTDLEQKSYNIIKDYYDKNGKHITRGNLSKRLGGMESDEVSKLILKLKSKKRLVCNAVSNIMQVL